MPAPARSRGPRPIGRWTWSLTGIGLTWAVLATAQVAMAQQVPPAPSPLPFRPRPTAEPAQAPATDPFTAPAPAADTATPRPGTEPAQAPARDLTTRYLLVETYSARDGEADRGLTQYQVAFRETVTESRDQAQGAPTSQVTVRQARFTERPVEVGPGDDRMVSVLVRRYEAARVDPNPWAKAGTAPLMADLTVWFESLPGSAPTHPLVDPCAVDPGAGISVREGQPDGLRPLLPAARVPRTAL